MIGGAIGCGGLGGEEGGSGGGGGVGGVGGLGGGIEGGGAMGGGGDGGGLAFVQEPSSRVALELKFKAVGDMHPSTKKRHPPLSTVAAEM